MINHPKILLMDVDGVLVRPASLFSHAHSRAESIEASELEPFFQGEFRRATIGQADLVELIGNHREMWHWDGEPEALLKRWFEHENSIDEPLQELLLKVRAQGVPVYLATNQEKYRADYLRRVMFPGTFDGIFVSCELGLAKPDPHYFELILEQLQQSDPDLLPNDLMFFDDSPSHVEGAIAAGLRAEVYTGHDQIKSLIV